MYKILSNPIYVGRLAHKGHVHEGQHPRIIERDLWDRVQQRLQEHVAATYRIHTSQSRRGSIRACWGASSAGSSPGWRGAWRPDTP
ncbi:MAG: recombinase family protein [Capsulimonadaceae bacterium]